MKNKIHLSIFYLYFIFVVAKPDIRLNHTFNNYKRRGNRRRKIWKLFGGIVGEKSENCLWGIVGEKSENCLGES